jgi:hypothetical protein
MLRCSRQQPGFEESGSAGDQHLRFVPTSVPENCYGRWAVRPLCTESGAARSRHKQGTNGAPAVALADIYAVWRNASRTEYIVCTRGGRDVAHMRSRLACDARNHLLSFAQPSDWTT